MSKGDDETGEVEEGAINFGVTLIANDQAAEVSQPGEGALDFPAMSVATEFASVLQLVTTGAAVGTNQFNALSVQGRPQFVAVVTLIGDQSMRFAFRPTRSTPWHRDGLQGALYQLHFRR